MTEREDFEEWCYERRKSGKGYDIFDVWCGAKEGHRTADAKKDAARLDFLIDKGAAVEAICGRYRVAKDYTLFSNWCDSPREAIDAAILAANKELK